ncbi:uncharacterized protein G2W53_035635 [Senna tora]|uniref:Uncharacterized protein n=1 Tax=Senna tora TaxID=362788 RepID=A0A834SW25_9FABA|nr:uncharacterized protein G2W53_035635 [Senna tora]
MPLCPHRTVHLQICKAEDLLPQMLES